jgi:hypothetical protein
LDRVETELARLLLMDRKQLLVKWQSELRQPPPAHLRRQILLPLLAYKLQEQAYGGLKPEVKRQLRQLAGRFESSRGKATEQLARLTRLKPGTRLVRTWKGEAHHVSVSEQGFEYKDRRYKSLSEIARLITGTRWSGPLFFGLKTVRR